MELLFTMVVPLTIAGVAAYGLGRGVDVYDALVQGAGGGLEVLARIFPALVGLMTAVSMLRASGALELAAGALAPVLDRGVFLADLVVKILYKDLAAGDLHRRGREVQAQAVQILFLYRKPPLRLPGAIRHEGEPLRRVDHGHGVDPAFQLMVNALIGGKMLRQSVGQEPGRFAEADLPFLVFA